MEGALIAHFYAIVALIGAMSAFAMVQGIRGAW